MKIVLQIFSAAMYLHCVATSYMHYGFNNSPKQFSGSGMPGSSDYANFGKVHRKRFSGLGKSKLIRGANDLLNSYFKIGSFPITYDAVPSAELRARATLVGEKPIKPRTQPTTGNVKVVKKVQQAEKPVFTPHTQIRALPANNPPAQPILINEDKPEILEPKPVKRPVIIIGHVRGGAGRGPPQEQTLRRYVAPTGQL